MNNNSNSINNPQNTPKEDGKQNTNSIAGNKEPNANNDNGVSKNDYKNNTISPIVSPQQSDTNNHISTKENSNNATNTNTSSTPALGNDSTSKKIETTNTGKDAIQTPVANNTTDAKKDDEKESGNGKFKPSFSISAYGGPSYSQGKTVYSNQAQNYISINEKSTYTYNAGIDFEGRTGNFILTTGIGIDNKAAKTDGSYTKIIGTKVDSTYIKDSVNGDYWKYDTSLATKIENVEGSNKYQYLRLQLLIGYNFNLTNKLYIAPSLGIAYNHLLYANSTNKLTTEFVSSKNSSTYSKYALSARIKLDIGMHINQHWGIGVQPAYTRFIQNIYTIDEYATLKPYSYDFNFYLRYKF